MRIVAIAQRIERILHYAGAIDAKSLFDLVETFERLDVVVQSGTQTVPKGRSYQAIFEAIEFGEAQRMFSLVMPVPGLEVVIGIVHQNAATRKTSGYIDAIEDLEDRMETDANMFRYASARGFSHVRNHCVTH